MKRRSLKIEMMSLILSVLLGVTILEAKEAAIDWQEWSPEAFAKAKQLDRPVFINVGHEGCIACRWMKESTFSEPAIIKTINENFVAIQVDSEMRPDIGERYSDWAWPALVFNSPDGTQVLAIRGNRRPDTFGEILEKIIEGHEAGTLQADGLAPYAAPEKVRESPMKEIRDQVRAQLDNSYDTSHAAWGETKIIEDPARLLHYAMRSLIEGDALAEQRFFESVDWFLGHIDKVWGGLFYESSDDGKIFVFEKRLESQAAGLQLFSTAYQLTGEQRYADAVYAIHRYLNALMRSQTGLYFANQQINLESLPDEMSFKAYYDLGDEARRSIGIPSIDRSLYTDLNARIVSGLVRAYEVTGKEAYLRSALNTAEALITTRKTKNNSFVQFKANSEFRQEERIHTVLSSDAIFLRPHAYLGQAFSDLYRATADEKWQKEAKNIASVLLELHDNRLGGFFGTTDQMIPRKPLEDNAVASYFLYQLGVLTKNKSYKSAAEKAIKATAREDIVRREGQITGRLALASELLTEEYIEFSIVGDPNEKAARELYGAAEKVYVPHKVLHYEAVGRYPGLDRPALYICTSQTCSLAITEAQDVGTEVNRYYSARATEK